MSEAASALHVVLVHPEIPWNTGNVGRTCLALGARLHLVRPLGFALTARELRRAGLDYWPRVPLTLWPCLDELVAALPALGEPYLLASGRGPSLWEVRFPTRCVLVLGRESVGLPAALLDRFAHRTVHVPMRDAALRSLNLSTCAAIALAEVARQHAADAATRRSP